MPDTAVEPRKVTLFDALEDLTVYLDTLDACATPEARAECELEVIEAMKRVVKKVDGFAAFRDRLDLAVAAARAEKDRLTERVKYLESAKARLDAYAIRAMQAHGVTKLEGELHTMRIQKNPPRVEITDESQLPADCIRVTVQMTFEDWLMRGGSYGKVINSEPMRGFIAERLKAGDAVPGAELVQCDGLRVT